MNFRKKIIATAFAFISCEHLLKADPVSIGEGCQTYQTEWLGNLNPAVSTSVNDACQKETDLNKCCSDSNDFCTQTQPGPDGKQTCVVYETLANANNTYLGLKNDLIGSTGPTIPITDISLQKGQKHYASFLANNSNDIIGAAFKFSDTNNGYFWNLPGVFWNQNESATRFTQSLQDARDKGGLTANDFKTAFMAISQPYNSSSLNSCIIALNSGATDNNTAKINAIMEAYLTYSALTKDDLIILLKIHNDTGIDQVTHEPHYADTPFSLAIRKNLPEVFQVLVNSCKNAGMTRDELYTIFAEKDKDGKTTTEMIASADKNFQDSIDAAFSPPA